ncbi:Transmembrane domain-containing protein [Spironucleus salmonicida]|nr:Transmembrane domain-containing protein [Spironucleus salmonicida]
MIKKSHSSIFVSSGVCTLSSFILFFIQNKFHVFSLVYCIFSLFLLIIVEIAPRTLFIGSASPPDVADFASTLEDEDTRSGEASYYYWAFHLLMMQAACYMSQVYSFSGPRVLYGVNFGFGVAGSFVFLLYLAWTAFLPVVLKNRIFE